MLNAVQSFGLVLVQGLEGLLPRDLADMAAAAVVVDVAVAAVAVDYRQPHTSAK